MSDNGYDEWITGLIAEAEAYTPAPAPKVTAVAPVRPTPKPRIRPTITKVGESTYATHVHDDGLVSFVTVDGPGWKL